MGKLKAIFGYEEAAWRVAAPAYFEALADIPADLLADAVRMIIANARSGDRFPRPGDIRELIREPLEVRRRAAAPLALPAPEQASGDMLPESKRITAEQAAAIVLRHRIRQPAPHRVGLVEPADRPRLTAAQMLARDGFRGVPMSDASETA